MNRKILACIALLLSALVIDASAHPRVIAETLKLFKAAGKTRAEYLALNGSLYTHGEMVLVAVRSPQIWAIQGTRLAAQYPDGAIDLMTVLPNLSPEEAEALARLIDAEIGEFPPAPRPRIIGRSEVPTSREWNRTCNLVISGIELGNATVFGSRKELQQLGSSVSPVRCVVNGYLFDELISTRSHPDTASSGQLLITLHDPASFRDMYEKAAGLQFQRCRTVGKICLGNSGASFSLGCGENLDLQITTEGTLSVSVSARSNQAEITLP